MGTQIRPTSGKGNFFPPVVSPRTSRVVEVALVALVALVGLTVIWMIRKRIYQPRPPPRLPEVPHRFPMVIEDPQAVDLQMNKNGYPENLVAALGGVEAFNQYPVLESAKCNLCVRKEGLNPYLKVDSSSMTHPIMRGMDPLGRPFILIRTKYKKSQKISVDVIICRDMKENRWYYNEAGSYENFPTPVLKGQLLWFIQQLIAGEHNILELV